MRRLLLAGEEGRLRTAASWRRGRGGDALVLSRLEYQVLVIETPPLREDRLDAALPYRLRALYPGSPESSAIDHRLNGPEVRERLVFACDAGVVTANRGLAPRLPLLASSLLLRQAARRGSWTGLFWTASWAELLRFSGRKMLSSVALEREGEAALDLERLFSLAPPEGCLVAAVTQDAEAERPSLERAAKTLYPGERVIGDLASILPSPRLAEAEIFPRNGKGRGKGLRILLGLLLAVDLSLVATLPLRWAGLAEGELAALKTSYEATKALRGEEATRLAELHDLETKLGELRAERPPDAYELIADIVACLGSSDRIRSLVIQDRDFRLEAEGPDALAVLGRLDASKRFESAALLQSVPLNPGGSPGRERYSISGRQSRD